MTNSEITQTIEKEFGWLSPDEKQKLNVMMIRTWNEAIVASADLAKVSVVVNDKVIAIIDSYSHCNLDGNKVLCIIEKHLINSLKLKL